MQSKSRYGVLFHSPLSVLGLRFVALLLLFSLSRIIFYLFNIHSFPQATFGAFMHGIRFDISILLYINSLYFVFLLLPFRFINSKAFRRFADIYFVLFNSVALLLNLIDTCYYPFSMRRMTFDIFRFIGETNNFSALLPVFLKNYYYMFFILLGFIALLILTVYLINKIDYQNFIKKSWHFLIQILLRLGLAFLMLTGMRGGWQYRPINIMAAGTAGGVENAALVLNSPFSLLTTINDEGLSRKDYFTTETECERYFSPAKLNFDNDYFTSPTTQNVVLIILEGISSEYSSFLSGNGQLSGYTPFMDSLAAHSIVFRGMANGQQSIEALSSILGGMPSLMSTPFTQSQFSGSFVQYPEPILKQHGMETVFFHGGKNGTMGFDNYCRLLGIEHYYGLDEYPFRDRDYDGTWGIFDVPYLQYVADVLTNYSKPFFATIYTLSSHHPFTIPAADAATLPQGGSPMQRTVAYTDMALKSFFEKVSKTAWFPNTLFVITADHTNYSGSNDVDYQRDRYSIPMIFYHHNADTAFVSNKIMQQTDIMPSIFAYCRWNYPFFSFGNNIFDKHQTSFAINYNSVMYNFYVDNYLIEFDGMKICYIWNLSQPTPRKPIALQSDLRFYEYEKILKSVIQQFNNRLLDNHLSVKK